MTNQNVLQFFFCQLVTSYDLEEYERCFLFRSPCIRQMNRVYGALESVVCPCYGAIEIVVVIIIP